MTLHPLADLGQGLAVAAGRAGRPQLRLHAEGGGGGHQLRRLRPARRRLLRPLQAGPQGRVPRLQGEQCHAGGQNTSYQNCTVILYLEGGRL